MLLEKLQGSVVLTLVLVGTPQQRQCKRSLVMITGGFIEVEGRLKLVDGRLVITLLKAQTAQRQVRSHFNRLRFISPGEIERLLKIPSRFVKIAATHKGQTQID